MELQTKTIGSRLGFRGLEYKWSWRNRTSRDRIRFEYHYLGIEIAAESLLANHFPRDHQANPRFYAIQSDRAQYYRVPQSRYSNMRLKE
jgi:hypothetical protein